MCESSSSSVYIITQAFFYEIRKQSEYFFLYFIMKLYRGHHIGGGVTVETDSTLWRQKLHLFIRDWFLKCELTEKWGNLLYDHICVLLRVGNLRTDLIIVCTFASVGRLY